MMNLLHGKGVGGKSRVKEHSDLKPRNALSWEAQLMTISQKSCCKRVELQKLAWATLDRHNVGISIIYVGANSR